MLDSFIVATKPQQCLDPDLNHPLLASKERSSLRQRIARHRVEVVTGAKGVSVTGVEVVTGVEGALVTGVEVVTGVKGIRHRCRRRARYCFWTWTRTRT